MNTQQHTPGPWVSHFTEDGWEVIKDEKQVFGRMIICGEIEQGEDGGMADAKLIAGAPHMIEALIKINEMCADMGKVDNGILNSGLIAQITIAAINIATK
mgnify:CR=1 FL=1